MSRVRAPKVLRSADLLGAPLGRERRQPEQAQTGDKDGDAHKDAEELALLLVGLELPVEIVIQKMPADSDGRLEGVPDAVDGGKRRGHAVRQAPSPRSMAELSGSKA